MLNIFVTNIVVIGIFICALILISGIYFRKDYGHINLDEILFYLNTGLDGASLDVVYVGIKENIIYFIILLFIFYLPLWKIKKEFKLKFKIKQKILNIQIYPFNKRVKIIYFLIILLITVCFSYSTFKVDVFLAQKSETSTFFEEQYIDSSEVQLTFPEKKRNLILIFLESMETTMMSEGNGGGWEYSVMPELEKLSKDSINFSNTDLVGGAHLTIGATWTAGGLIATTAGIPAQYSLTSNTENDQGKFLRGAYTLGDILEKEEYNSTFFLGSYAEFGKRDQYFKTHGNYEIFDLSAALDSGKIRPEDTVFWGVEDGNLLEWSKEEILSLAQKDEPFNFNLLTVNTHFEDGWLEDEADKLHSTQYENVHAYSSKQIREFLDWLMQQEFYENTAVVLVGDHLSMQSLSYYEDKITDDFQRVIWNVFINSSKKPLNEKERIFSQFDYFPTILSSIGVEIEGDKLGLGIDLFSGKETLFEKYGVDFVNHELSQRSIFYDQKIVWGR